MTRLSAQSIRRIQPVEPFVERGVSNGRSYGLSCCSYDIRIAESLWLWPLWGRLASAIETFDMPDDVSAEVKDKSSNARRFITVQNTLIDPGFRGHLTLELTRHLPWPTYIRHGTPIAQILFDRLDEPTEMPYRGKYQNQEAGPQKARHEGEWKSFGTRLWTLVQQAPKSLAAKAKKLLSWWKSFWNFDD